MLFLTKKQKTKNMKSSFKINWDTIRQGKFPKKELEEIGLIIDISCVTETKQEITILSQSTLTNEDIFYIGSIVSKLQKF